MRESRELQGCALEGDGDYMADAVRRVHNSAAEPHYYYSEEALRAAVNCAKHLHVERALDSFRDGDLDTPIRQALPYANE